MARHNLFAQRLIRSPRRTRRSLASPLRPFAAPENQALVELRGSILIGDPDRAERTHLMRVLGGEGFLPFEAESRTEALALAREYSPDLALLDAYFPDGSGLDACERLRALARGVRVIVFTGDPSRELRRDALSAGAYAVVPKPLRRRVVLATVEAALGCGPRWGWH